MISELQSGNYSSNDLCLQLESYRQGTQICGRLALYLEDVIFKHHMCVLMRCRVLYLLQQKSWRIILLVCRSRLSLSGKCGKLMASTIDLPAQPAPIWHPLSPTEVHRIDQICHRWLILKEALNREYCCSIWYASPGIYSTLS